MNTAVDNKKNAYGQSAETPFFLRIVLWCIVHLGTGKKIFHQNEIFTSFCV